MNFHECSHNKLKLHPRSLNKNCFLSLQATVCTNSDSHTRFPSFFRPHQSPTYPMHMHTSMHSKLHHHHKSDKLYTSNKCSQNVSPLQKQLSAKRRHFNNALMQTTMKINTTFAGLMDKTQIINHMEQHQSKILSKMKRAMRNNKDAQTRKCSIKDDYFTDDNNMFSIREESLQCNQISFQIYRLGATLACHDQSIYLFGGNSFKTASTPTIHYYSELENCWHPISAPQGQLPLFSPSFHSALSFKQYLIFIGGMAINLNKNRRYYNNEVNLFNPQRKEWSKYRWDVCVRSHASCVYGNLIVVHGGINEKEQMVDALHFINLNINNLMLSSVISLKPTGPPPIAYHKMISTSELQPSLKSKLQIEGLLIFGGKHSDGTTSNDILLFRMNPVGRESYKGNEVGDRQWQAVPTKGRKPLGRYDHAMQVLNKHGIFMIIGGTDVAGNILNDAWIFNLLSFTWLLAEFDEYSPLLTNGLTAHASTINDSQIFIFGGSNAFHLTNNTFFNIEFSATRGNAQHQKMKGKRVLIKSKRLQEMYSNRQIQITQDSKPI